MDPELMKEFTERLGRRLRRIRYRDSVGLYPREKASAYHFLKDQGMWSADGIITVYRGIRDGGCRYPLYVRNYVCETYRHVLMYTIRRSSRFSHAEDIKQ